MRRRGYEPDRAQDLPQGFFTELLEKRSLKAVRRERGRFRSFLLAALKFYLSHERERAGTRKRGGNRALIRLDVDTAEGRYRLELTVHWNDYLRRYLAIHSPRRERTIALRTAERPQGPWSEPRLYVVGVPWTAGLDPQPNQPALGHPEFSREGGRIEYITYQRTTGPFWTNETRLVEITFR